MDKTEFGFDSWTIYFPNTNCIFKNKNTMLLYYENDQKSMGNFLWFGEVFRLPYLIFTAETNSIIGLRSSSFIPGTVSNKCSAG